MSTEASGVSLLLMCKMISPVPYHLTMERHYWSSFLTLRGLDILEEVILGVHLPHFSMNGYQAIP